ncbi:hypothetical protein [Nostoc sp. 2RC]|uniref:hypothetical protein n=1 Tax=Nostoc sp. 2RC TaxID=2485484 RepID=UPI0016294202|nr:hypothetical protein [Nostoc sp. 2RC]MBC1241053.1 hypothetical protein [Nostoc sp. 2RC]
MHRNTKRFAAIFVLVFSLIVSLNFAVIAQDTQNVPSLNPSAFRTCSVPSYFKTKQVIADNGGGEVKMGDRIKIQVEGLSKATNLTAGGTSFDPRQLVLYLNGYELQDVYAQPTIVMVRNTEQKLVVDEDWLAFRLERNDPSENVWNALIGRPKYSINVVAGVGCPNKIAIPVSNPESPPQIKIVLFSWRFWLCLLLVLVVVLLFTRYCRNSLRSSGIEGIYSKKEVIDGQELLIPERVNIEPQQRKTRIAQFFLGRKKINRNPFSLSVSQLAFWTLIIFGSYMIIYGITGDYTNILNQQSLILLGINSVTAFGSSLIDGQGDESKRKGSQRVSEGFFIDILSDINGVNFHRFQTFIWTVAIGVFFLWEVGKNLAMPEFDETLLTLQGISSATYLGLRGQEQHGMVKNPENPKSQKDNSFEQQPISETNYTPMTGEQDYPQESDASSNSG